jgi:hypothetical protein
MPNVTSRPFAALLAAVRTAAWKAPVSAMA